MIPPFLITKAASLVAPLVEKFSSPLIKWGSIAGVVVILIGYTNWKTYDHMRTQCEESKIAAIAEQSKVSAHQVMAQDVSTQAVLAQHAEAEREVAEKIKLVERKVVQYVQAKPQPCVLDSQLVELFDAISRVPDDKDLVPAAHGSAGESVESSETGLTGAEAVQAYAVAVEELTWLWVDYAALVEWERGRYIVEKTGFEHE